MSNNAGGVAFPTYPTFPTWEEPRIALREYFAAKAMQGMISTLTKVSEEPLWAVIAKDSYKMADAMLEARSEA